MPRLAITRMSARGALRCSLLLAFTALGSAAQAQPGDGAAGVPPATIDAARRAGAERALALGGATAEDAAALLVTDAHVDRATGLAFVYLAQAIGGVEVDAGRVAVGLGAGRAAVFHVAGALVPGVAGLPPAAPALDATAAAGSAARAVGLAASVGAVGPPEGAARVTPLAVGGAAGRGAEARLTYVGGDGAALRLAWRVTLPDPAAPHLWRIDVDAATGAVLAVADLVLRDAFGPLPAPGPHPPPAGPRLPGGAAVGAATGTYRVFAHPTESPDHGGRTLVAGPADATASPYGWHDTDGTPSAEFTTTRGNNVSAAPHPGLFPPRAAPDGGPALAFDFPFDPAAEPGANLDAAVTNAFYWANVAHDVLYRYGFDEAAGNFQQNTYGRGGLGGDPVLVEVESPQAPNAARFFPSSDGMSPVLELGVWTYTTPARDIAFDAGVVAHEYGHGLSTRLVGGPAQLCLGGAEQPGEGWSDYVALLLTMRPGDTRHTPRGIATYGLGQPPTGGGLRPAPYAADFAVNPYTYGATRAMAGPHPVGFVWATALWEATWDLIEAYGFSPDVYDADGGAGNQLALRLLVTALKLTPCSPGFVDARDAVLSADAALYGGAHLDLLWGAFARRGLGYSASQGSAAVLTDNEEAFDLPLPAGTAAVSPSSVTLNVEPGGAATATVTVTNTAPAGASGLSLYASYAFTGEASGAPAPAAFGYQWRDSSMPDGPPIDFHRLVNSGTYLPMQPVPPSGSGTVFDEGYAEIDLPFPFPFYGSVYDRAYVSLNGFLAFRPFTGATRTNSRLPALTPPNALVAPFWDDLKVFSGQPPGGVYTAVLPDGRFALHYYGTFSDFGSAEFQVILAPFGTIEYQYGLIAPGYPWSMTIGIEDEEGRSGVQIAYHTPLPRTGFAVRIEPPTSVRVSSTAGHVAPGSSTTVTLAFDAAGLPPGTYTGELRLATNEVGNPILRLPVAFTVNRAPDTEPPPPAPPGTFALRPPSPNPAAGAVTLRYDVPEASDVTVEVLDMLGRRVAVLAEGRAEPGRYAAVLEGNGLASGLYVVRMQAGPFVQTQRLTVAR